MPAGKPARRTPNEKASAGTRPAPPRRQPAPITIVVRRLPEGVYLATSDDLPGLTVETATREEMIDEARRVALDLLEEMHKTPDRQRQSFAFVFET